VGRQYTPRVECRCATCGVRFYKPPSVIAQGGGKYCGRACTPRPTRPRTQQQRTCERCGKQFWVHAYRVAEGHGRYCSIACAKRKHPAHPATFTCETCGTVRPWPRNRAGNTRPRFCNSRCYGDSLGAREARTCVGCGQAFSIKASSRQHYHSRACYAWKLETWRVRSRCERCQRWFPRPPSHTWRRYCSTACRTLAQAPREYTCANCGRHESRPPWRNARYCSRACANRHGPRQRHADTWVAERNAWIVKLADDGRTSQQIAQRLATRDQMEHRERGAPNTWALTPAAVRKVLERVRRRSAVAHD
jgi:hypothetical protein